MPNRTLTDQEIDEYHEAFNLIDRDGDGSITLIELGNLMKNIGRNTTHADLLTMVRSADLDGNGTVEFREFLFMMGQQRNDHRSDHALLDAFNAFDMDRNGFICEDELQSIMMSLGERLTMDEIREMIHEADTDGDGHISYREFAKMMKPTRASSSQTRRSRQDR